LLRFFSIRCCLFFFFIHLLIDLNKKQINKISGILQKILSKKILQLLAYECYSSMLLLLLSCSLFRQEQKKR
jgi:hypothetical protein